MCSVARCGQRWTQLTSGPLGHCPRPAGALPLAPRAECSRISCSLKKQYPDVPLLGAQDTAEMPDWKPWGSVGQGGQRVLGWWAEPGAGGGE